MFVAIALIAVLAVLYFYCAYKWPAAFGIASKEVGTSVDAAAAAVEAKIATAPAQQPAPPQQGA